MVLLHVLRREAEVDMALWFRVPAGVDPVAPTRAPFAGAFHDWAKRRDHAAALRAWLWRASRLIRGRT